MTAGRWATVHPERRVLAVARTLTSAVRLLEVLDLLRSDFRVQVTFAVDTTSAFTAGVDELLAGVGARVVPWEHLGDLAVDVVVTASENVDLTPLCSPVVVLPHGVGFHKYVPDSNGHGVRLSGLVPERYLAGGDVLLVASHRDQIAQLEAASPGITPRTVVAGDVCFDRLLASRRLRQVYRRHLGVDDDRRLVVLTSTWGDQSLWGHRPDLPRRLLAQLPADEYRVAMILHPNVWSAHTPWQVRAWLADARDAGLAVIPPTAGWQASVVAADVVVGDHGSVTFYAAALGVPVLLAAFGSQAVPGTPMAALRCLAPRLDPTAAPGPQLDRTITKHDPARSLALAAAAFQDIGEAARRVRGVLYRRMGLPEPTTAPVTRAWPPPRPEVSPARSFVVTIDVGGEVMVVRRVPAIVADRGAETSTVLRCLAAYDDEPDPTLIESAAVVVCRSASASGSTLRAYPGARIAAAGTPDGCVAAVRDGPTVTATAREAPDIDPMVLAAVIYARSRLRAPYDGTVQVRLGPRTVTVRLSAGGG
jgi:hypothetical protein